MSNRYLQTFTLAMLVILSGQVIGAENNRRALVDMSPEEIFDDPKAVELAYASITGDQEAIESLVSNGVDANVTGYLGVTLLFLAIRPDNIEAFEQLLILGADPNSLVASNLSPIHLASSISDEYFLDLCLRHKGNPNLLAADGLTTPLISAAASSRSHINNTKLLIQNSADIEQKSSLDRTPILRAAVVYRYDIAYELIQAGADTTVTYGRRGRGLKEIISTSGPGMFNTPVHSEYRKQVMELLGMEF